ncbi:blood group A-and B-cleaving endo-beta-galactosidase [Streptococcus varani]|uniref:Blood group A-and B-cleaving endo-beta-galactosidase n=1 Tax=Streptococcus varani TaxID=1608583 RepID=A0A0E3WF66_9STRE|nr:glycosyl hydrolase family 98 C-terminal domain-containing protein [Streptococcus varani]CQR24960.1 blood group A-and B-cleaving endo-beta-galactosidase [Streptococcus varani]
MLQIFPYNGASIEKALGTQGKDIFKKTVEKYSDNFIFMYKNTPAAEGNDAPTASYMKGLWLANYAHQWGGLMDTWKWYETGKWKLFADGNIGKTQGNRQWLTEPEAMLGAEAMNIYLNGGTVYNFEHPAYTYGVKNQASPLFDTVIKNFFKYIVEHPAPSKDEVLANTAVLLRGNYSQNKNGHFFEGVNTAEMASTANRKTTLDSLYKKEYEGDIFADKIDNRLFVYNYEYNKDRDQKGNFELNGKPFDLTLKSHSYAIVTDTENGLSIKLNNFRINKDSLWGTANSALAASLMPTLSKEDAIKWVDEVYIHNTPASEQQETVILLKNSLQKPTVNILSSSDSNMKPPVIEYNATTKTTTIKIITNGNVDFNINY